MKQLTILLTAIAAIGLLLLGATLLLVGLLFKQLGWHDAFNGSVSGLAVIGLAVIGWLVFTLVSALTPNAALAGQRRLSSRFVVYAKLFPPYCLLAVWLVVALESYFSQYRADIFWPLTLFFGVLLGFASYLGLRLYTVAETDSQYAVYGYAKCYMLPKSGDVVKGGSRLLAWIAADGRRYFYIPALL